MLIEEALCHREAGYDAFKFRPGTDWQAAGMTLERYAPILSAYAMLSVLNFALCTKDWA